MKVDDYFKKRDETKTASPEWTGDQVSRYALCWMGKRRFISISVEKDSVQAALNEGVDACGAYAAADPKLPAEFTKAVPAEQLKPIMDDVQQLYKKWSDDEKTCVNATTKSSLGLLPIAAKRLCICMQGMSAGANAVNNDDDVWKGSGNLGWCMGLAKSITAREAD